MRDDAGMSGFGRGGGLRAPVAFETADGRRLRGQLHLPDGPPRAAAVLHGATGVPARFYGAFADWLAAEAQIACLTYDYRGFGASQAGALRREPATMLDWGMTDQPAALAMVAQRFPATPLWVIGHSLGGLFVERHAGMERVEQVIVAASAAIHWTRHDWRFVPMAATFWWGPGAWATAALGYLPGRALGFGADLPAGVFWQWRRWCVSRAFATPELGPAPERPNGSYRVLFVAAEDDRTIPPPAIWAAMGRFPGRAKRQLTLERAAFGGRPIGHLGAFGRGGEALWRAMLARAVAA